MDTIAAIIGWIVFGFIVGLLGRLFVPGRQPLGFLGTTILGVIGSFAGGAIGALFTGKEIGDPAGWIMMAYNSGDSYKDVIADLKFLLKNSRG